ncbi:CU044_5270 family protein [Streptomyces sp. NBC_01340]|uniref:CU044_5270 family protein n=1 Tax=unclassified Streptomyces TaxID=2593676 RepID=UPI00224EFBC3|nr:MULTISPECIES: CU044_5270 family protein [unclassified Streptomyces]MCX4451870.1 CU044_5270 family protein [Streptomyces sp. NBC_01719]MCX4491230.1 CU044_5270 family protein [Streptomyces sp. NBC_01728]MCX4594188.1 CU044_5270 family protein [Streptomyces sp. NBC_01549]WSI36557.1 CU044_5270 family protein [Streptomyces sp. NBC_01340]
MADELDILRRANPVTAADPRFHDRPLDQHAERRLNRLLHGERDSGRPRPLRRWVWSVAATAAVGVVVLTLTLSGSTTTPAVAAPRPLMVDAGSTPVPLDRLADAVAASGSSLRLVQGTHVQTWSMGLGPGARPPITVPVERVVRWKADGSSSELVVATDPRHPGRPVLTDDDPVRTVEDGHVLSRRTFPPSWSDAPPMARPPHDAERLRSYLEEIDRRGAMDTSGLLDAVGELLGNWTLGTREDAALLRVLADAKGLRPAGAVTDRLGRQGQAYVYDDATHFVRRMLILDPGSGAVLGIEDTVTKDDPEFGVKAGDVMSYSAWMR